MNGRAKYWCYTINNFGSAEVLGLRRHGRSGEIASYIVFGREGRGPGGTPHLQGFVAFRSRQRGTQVKAFLGGRAHVEVARASSDEAIAYCCKEGDFEEYGTRPAQRVGAGRRSDLERIRSGIAGGVSTLEIAEQHFGTWIYHRRAFSAYRDLLSAPRSTPSAVHVYWGGTGVGKTRRVLELEPELWIASDNQLQWFDGYAGQAAALFDDFVGCKNRKFGFLLRLLDRYPMNVPVKGGFVNWRLLRIYITSNLPPEHWFLGVTHEQVLALRRRFSTVTHFGGLN